MNKKSLLTLIVFFCIIIAIASTSSETSSETKHISRQTQSEPSVPPNMTLVEPGSLVVINDGEQIDDPVSSIAFRDGTHYESGFSRTAVIDTTRISAPIMVPDSDKFEIVNPDNPVIIQNFSKIESDIVDEFKTKTMVPIIIHFNLSFDNFYAHATVQQRNDRLQEYRQCANKIRNLIQNKSSGVYRELKIIASLSASVKSSALADLEHHQDIKKVTLDRTAEIILDESLEEINVFDVWSSVDSNGNTITGVGMRIAIIDTGVDYLHADLGGCFGKGCKVIDGWDFTNDDADPMDDNGHGTHVAATAAGNGLLQGVAPDADILAYKVCNSQGSCSFSAIIAGIERATDPNQDGDPSDHVDTANMSLGGFGDPDDPLSVAVDNSTAAGVVHAVAAGNSGPGGNGLCRHNPDGTINSICSPGTARTAITVAAACKQSQMGIGSCADGPIANFSSRGPLFWMGDDLHKPDISTPGVLICAARWDSAFVLECFDSQHVRISGTSMATPHVAGGAALIRQALPDLTPDEIKQLITFTATDLGAHPDEQGAGMLNMGEALAVIPQIDIEPNFWQINSDPTVQTSEQSILITVTPINEDINTLDIDLDFTATGIDVTSDASSINIPTSFSVTAVINNDEATEGFHNGKIFFSENEEIKGVGFFTIFVEPTFTISPENIDYGIDVPAQDIWNSDVVFVGIANLRNDIPQLATIDLIGFPEEVTFNVSTSELEIPPGQTVQFDTSITVDNTTLTNGTYNGQIVVSVGNQTIFIPAKFIKFFVLTIAYTDQDPNTNIWFGYIACQNVFIFLNGLDGVAFFEEEDTCDLMVHYIGSENGDGWLSDVIQENIVIDQAETAIEVNRQQATNRIEIIGTDENDQTLPLYVEFSSLNPLGSGGCESMFVFNNDDDFNLPTRYISNTSQFRLDRALYSPNIQPAEKMYVFGGTFIDVFEDILVSNTVDDLQFVQTQIDLNITDGTLIAPMYEVSIGSDDDLNCGASFSFLSLNTDNWLSAPTIQTLAFTTERHYFTNYSHSALAWTECSDGEFCIKWSVAPEFNNTTDRLLGTGVVLGFERELPPIENGIQYNGLGPLYWSGQLKIVNNEILFRPLLTIMTFSPLLLRQDFAYQHTHTIDFIVSQNGQQVYAGVIPETFKSYGSNLVDPIPIQIPGEHLIEFDFNYEINRQQMTANVTMFFDTINADASPPGISQLYFYSDGHRSDRYDASGSSILLYGFDAVGGLIAGTSVGVSTDGINFDVVDMIAQNDLHMATMPAIEDADYVFIKISGTDDSSNTLDFVFQIPTSSNCLGDGDGNNIVDVEDLLFVLGKWGDIDSPADVNNDGVVDIEDLLIILETWGPCEL